MPLVEMVTGEVIRVDENVAKRVKNNQTAMHYDKKTGVKFAGQRVSVIYPDKYEVILKDRLVPVIEDENQSPDSSADLVEEETLAAESPLDAEEKDVVVRKLTGDNGKGKVDSKKEVEREF